MNVLLPRALREPLRCPKPALPLPKSGTFRILRSFPGCLSQHLCLCPSPVPVCVHVCQPLWALLFAAPALLQMIFFILFETALQCSTVTVWAEHTFYMPSILKEKKPQGRLFRKRQNPPLCVVAKNYLHSHTFADKNTILCMSRACILCAQKCYRSMCELQAWKLVHSSHFKCIYLCDFYFLLHMLLSCYPQACYVSHCFSALSICLSVFPARIPSLFYCSSPSLMVAPQHIQKCKE